MLPALNSKAKLLSPATTVVALHVIPAKNTYKWHSVSVRKQSD